MPQCCSACGSASTLGTELASACTHCAAATVAGFTVSLPAMATAAGAAVAIVALALVARRLVRPTRIGRASLAAA